MITESQLAEIIKNLHIESIKEVQPYNMQAARANERMLINIRREVINVLRNNNPSFNETAFIQSTIGITE